jgi:hypothetical protein
MSPQRPISLMSLARIVGFVKTEEAVNCHANGRLLTPAASRRALGLKVCQVATNVTDKPVLPTPVSSAMSLAPTLAQQLQVTDLAPVAGVAGAPTLRLLQATGHCSHVRHPAEVASVIEQPLASG